MNRPSTQALAVVRPVIMGLTVVNIFYILCVTGFLIASFLIEDWPGRELGFDPETMDARAPFGLRGIIVIGMCVGFIVHTILRRLLAIVDTVRAGDPFDLQNARRLVLIAWSVLAIEVLRLTTLLIASTVGIPGHVSGLTPTPWLAVLLLFVLSGVFAHGARMRTDLEGTI